MIERDLRRRGLVALLLIAAWAGAAGAEPRLEIAARHGDSTRGTLDGLTVLVLRGTHQQRGEAHGALAAREIVAVLDEAIIPAVNDGRPEAWQKRFIPAVRAFHWPERFDREIAGMFAGLRQALPDPAMRTLKSLGREIAVDDLKALNILSDLMGPGCSSFSAWGPLTEGGKVITGRNLDYAAFRVAGRAGLIANVPAERDLRPTLDAGVFGSLAGGTTLNSEGVFVALHDVRGLPGRRENGWVPRLLALRQAVEGARAGSAVDDVAAVLKRSPVRVGNNIHVSFPVNGDRTPAVLEWDGNGKDGGVTIRNVDPSACDCCLVCTNHFLARAAGSGDGRFGTLLSAAVKLRGNGGRIDVAGAKAMLDSVGRSGALVTHLSAVVEPSERRMHVAFSPDNGRSATRGRWVTVEWTTVFGQ